MSLSLSASPNDIFRYQPIYILLFLSLLFFFFFSSSVVRVIISHLGTQYYISRSVPRLHTIKSHYDLVFISGKALDAAAVFSFFLFFFS